MTRKSLYMQEKVTLDDMTDIGKKTLFVGIDLAPIDTLETGIALLNRDKQLLRMDKLNDDAQIHHFIENVAPADNIVVTLDIPKSLEIPTKWRQQEIKMHPLRLDVDGRELTDRFASRAWEFYETARKKGIFIVAFFGHHAKMRYDIRIPYKVRSPAGCKALQRMIREELRVQDVPTNLAPSSVLDAMIAAYAGWTAYAGEEGVHFDLYRDDKTRLYLDPLKSLKQIPVGNGNDRGHRGRRRRRSARPR